MGILPQSSHRDGRQAHPLFETWRGMVRRCHDPKATGYKNYGGRGIAVCQRWRSDFWAFVADVGEKPLGYYTLDRIDNDGAYEPGNVRWGTQDDQHRNARFNRLVMANSKTQTMQDWCAELGMSKSTFENRIRRGWTDEQIINTPVQPKAANNSLFPIGGREIVKKLGLNLETVKSRLYRGWSFEDAITKPLDHQRERKKR